MKRIPPKRFFSPFFIFIYLLNFRYAFDFYYSVGFLVFDIFFLRSLSFSRLCACQFCVVRLFLFRNPFQRDWFPRQESVNMWYGKGLLNFSSSKSGKNLRTEREAIIRNALEAISHLAFAKFAKYLFRSIRMLCGVNAIHSLSFILFHSLTNDTNRLNTHTQNLLWLPKRENWTHM